ncbi:uncharacterized protein F5891DRAFT_1183801 [Suillus fuscotomentosus]|uniref:Uncharacterized protein n=1 Tax=Suillus fuscotomentosus TaxID=1912939 RepID=A0AAD4EF47_9AGAM|nr:uncharacterized protein F5891DRAFT_1183801 [Suillus fuscotomentosus]KAG1905095.1 hypothetical protein F5891DRAFT_1183801 [Suillus fuscotomentosus]
MIPLKSSITDGQRLGFNRKQAIHTIHPTQVDIELALDCMLDGPPSTVTVSERLEQLLTIRRAWTLFEWKKEVRVPMPAPGHTLVRNDIGISTRDFAIDPSQDLIAFVHFDDDPVNNSNYTAVHIHTIPSNVKHPEASSPILRTLTPSIMTSAFIQIVDDVIGMMFWMELDNPCITNLELEDRSNTCRKCLSMNT